MTFSKKLITLSAAAVLAATPVAAVTSFNTTAHAATTIHATYGKHSTVTVRRAAHFYSKTGKKLSRTTSKGAQYTIWDVKTIKGQVYLSIQTDFKYWLKASDVNGSVQYTSGNKTVKLTIKNGKVTTTNTKKSSKKSTKKTTKKSSSKKSSSKSTKKTTKKSTKKSSSKKSSSKTTKKTTKKSSSTSVVTIKTIRKTHVVNAKGKKVTTYMGSKKYATIGKNVTLKGLGTKTINGKKYYALTPNKYYISASDVTVVK